jgi:hypothetical protein
VGDRKSVDEQVKEFEDELKKTKYNKRTQYHVGLVKAKIARLKEQDEIRRSSQKKGEGYSVKKSGDVTAILLGFPSVGKSSILNVLTNADSEVGAYDFTTLDVIPGLMEHRHAKIQILDVPGIVSGAASGRGRGREVLSVVRSADLVIVVLDAKQPQQYDAIMKEIIDAHIRVNQRKPDVKIKKTAKDGVRVGTTVKLHHIDTELVRDILKEFKMMNADVLIRDDVTVDQFIDVVEGNKVYLPALLIANKRDIASPEEIKKLMDLEVDLFISAKDKVNIDVFKDLIYDRVGLISIYLKEPSKEADMKEPLIIRRNSTLQDLCEKLHRDFVTKFKFARVWGKSVKFPGQKLLKLSHVLQEGDIVEIHLK